MSGRRVGLGAAPVEGPPAGAFARRLSDVMATGHHAAVADVSAGGVIAVVGDGAVGLSGVLAAKRLGAERIIALSRHPVRQALAREFGATDIVEQRGEAATAAVMQLTGGVGVDATLGGACDDRLDRRRPASRVGVRRCAASELRRGTPTSAA